MANKKPVVWFPIYIVYSGVKSNVGYRIRKLRVARDFNQGQMAEKLSITPSAYSKIERGTTDPSVGRLEQIAAILQVNIADFFTDVQKQTPAGPSGLEELTHKLNALTREVAQLKKTVSQLTTSKSIKAK